MYRETTILRQAGNNKDAGEYTLVNPYVPAKRTKTKILRAGDIFDLRKAGFNEVRQQAAEDLLREKQQKAYEELLQRMMQTQKVEIYDDLVK